MTFVHKEGNGESLNWGSLDDTGHPCSKIILFEYK